MRKNKIVRQKTEEGPEKIILFNEKVIYSLPGSIGCFLAHISQANADVKIIPWSSFKDQVFKIYNERLKDDWEISGNVLNSFIAFEEYIGLYFIKTYKQKSRAELKMLEF